MAATATTWAAVRTFMRSLHFSAASSSSTWADDALRRMDRRDTWDRFYAEKRKSGSSAKHFDWFFGYEDVSGFLLSLLQDLPPGPAWVLDVGCGTSALGAGLYRDSLRQLHVSCLDFSAPAIDSLCRLLELRPLLPRHSLSQLHCQVADATDLRGTFEPATFDLVLDKGTCDTLLRCPQGTGRARRLVAECRQVLRPQGSLLQFSDEDPDARVPFLEEAAGVSVTVQEIGCIKGVSYYAYLLRQTAPDSAGSSGELE